jgi:hypothetical protein
MRKAAAVALVLVAIVIWYGAYYMGFRAPVAGTLENASPTQLYYAPKWLGALDKSPDRWKVLYRCWRDPNCAAVAYTSETQAAAQKGHTEPGYCGRTPDPPECLAEVTPYQLSPGADEVFYYRRTPLVGPDVYVKRRYAAIAKS